MLLGRMKGFFVILLGVVSLGAQGFLTQEEISLFHQQRYLVKRGCFTAAEMDQLNARVTAVVDRALQQIGQLPNGAAEEDQITYVDGSRLVFKQHADQSISISRINGCSGMDPELLDILRSDKMVRTFFELLGTRDLEHIICQLHPKLPGDGIAYPSHRDIQFRKAFDPDWQDVLGNGSYVICVIPIDPMSRENGGLWVTEDTIWLEANPGDLIFMHPELVHGSGPNESPTKARKTLLTGFCAFGANHKPYPGADVNMHLALTDRGEISMQSSPWNDKIITNSMEGH